jgi:acetolactate synthase-1/2/3 large subunit
MNENLVKKLQKRPLTGAHLLALSLLEEGVTDLFGYPGGAIMPFYDVITEYSNLRHILVRNEQGAALAAIGYSRVTGHEKIGVCVATSGPGATNLVTGIYDAYMDSMPIIAITGQVPTFMVGTDAFQEADMIGITQPITKQSYFVTKAEDIPSIVKEAFHIARSGRPGPVLIDLPKDVQNQIVEKFEYPQQLDLKGYKPKEKGNKRMIKEASDWLMKAEKPLLLVGHGIMISHAMSELMDFVKTTGIPVVSTLHGIGSFPESHPLSLGWLGMHGFTHCNYAVQECDVLLGIGLRFDDRIIGKADDFAPNAKIIHVDIDPAEIGKNVHTELPIVGDARQVLQDFNQMVSKCDIAEWVDQINVWREKHPLPEHHQVRKIEKTSTLTMRSVVRELYTQTKGKAVIASDVGQHQMITAQEYVFDEAHSHLTSGGSGTMGFALPAGMGAQVAEPEKEVWAVIGDGSFQMNLQELITLAQDKIPLKIAILNNSFLGMVRQWQELFYDKNYSSTPLANPDFVLLAEACGIKALRATSQKEAEDAIRAMREEKGPILCDFVVETEENVYPMVPAGKSLSDTITGL